jgi:uncharacterized membrane protein
MRAPLLDPRRLPHPRFSEQCEGVWRRTATSVGGQEAPSPETLFGSGLRKTSPLPKTLWCMIPEHSPVSKKKSRLGFASATFGVPSFKRSALWRRSSVVALSIVFGLALWVRLHDLGRLSLWLDEGTTTLKMRFTLSELFRYTVVDNVPPLYYFALGKLGFWIDSDISLRLPSVVFGVATIPVLFLIAQRLFNRRVALLSSLFLSLSTFHVWFSQEARSYSLYCFLYALSLLFLVKWSQSASARWTLLLYVAATSLMMYSHSTALMYCGINQIVFLLLCDWRDTKKIRTWLVAQVVVAIFFLPWLSSFRTQSANYRQRVASGPLDYNPGILIETLMELTSMAPLISNEATQVLGHTKHVSEILNLSWFVSFVGAFAMCFLSWEPGLWRRYLVAASLVIVPLIALTLFSVWVVNVYIDRLFLPSTLGIALLLALGTQNALEWSSPQDPKAWFSSGFLLLILAHLTLSLASYYRLERKEDFRSASAYVVQQYKTSDLLVFVTYSAETLFNWYHPEQLGKIQRTGIPRSFLDPPNQPDAFVIRTLEDISSLQGLAGNASRIWLVRLRTQYHDPDELTFKWLDQHCRRDETRQFHGVSVDLFSGCRL